MTIQSNYHNNSSLFVAVILSFLTISIGLVGLNIELIVSISRVLTYSLVGILFLIYLFKSNGRFNIDNRLLFVFLLAFWVGLRSDNLYGVGLFIQSFFLLMTTFILYNLNLSSRIYNVLPVGGFLFVFMAFLHFFYMPIFSNTNYIGVCGLIFLVLFLSRVNKISYFLAFLCLILIFISGTRSAILGLIIGYMLYIIFGLRFYARLSSILFLLIAIFLFLTSGLYDYLNSEEFAQIVIDKTGKRLESGRFEIWSLILSKMSLWNYFFGLGGGTDYEKIIGSKLSAHSGYVYIFSSYGFIGLILFIISAILSAIKLHRKKCYFSFLLFTALLFRELFEVTLLHNSFPIALFFWAILSNGYLDRFRLASSVKFNN